MQAQDIVTSDVAPVRPETALAGASAIRRSALDAHYKPAVQSARGELAWIEPMSGATLGPSA